MKFLSSGVGLAKKAGRGLVNVAQKPRVTVGQNLFNKAELAGAGAAFGFIHGKYREAAEINVPGIGKCGPDILVGVGGTVIAGLVNMFTKGKHHGITSHLDTIATAGLVSWAHTEGARMGVKSAGRQLYLGAPGVRAPGLTETVFGHIPNAPAGTSLSGAELRAAAAL